MGVKQKWGLKTSRSKKKVKVKKVGKENVGKNWIYEKKKNNIKIKVFFF